MLDVMPDERDTGEEMADGRGSLSGDIPADAPGNDVAEVGPPTESPPPNGSGPSTSPRTDLIGDLHTLRRTAEHAKRSERAELLNFRHIVQAWLWSRCEDDEYVREEAGRLLPDLVDAFARRSHGVEKMSFYEKTGAGVALTNINRAARKSRPAIHIEAVATERRDPKARHLVIRTLDLHNRALRHLSPSSRRILLLRLHSILESLLGQSEGARVANEQLAKEDYSGLEKELAAAHRYYDDSVQRSAQLTYFIGTLFMLVPFILAALYLVWPDKGEFDLGLTADEELLAASSLAGASGAAVSVMTRLASGKLTLTGLDEASRTNLIVFGAMRTLLGVAFGALVFLFIFSTMLDIKVPDPEANANTRLYFLIVLGFIAGFSERFAQDALTGAEASVAGVSAPQSTTTPSRSTTNPRGRRTGSPQS